LKEAQYLLRVAHSQREICRTIKYLATLRLEEARLRAKLHVIQADRAQEELDNADMNVGTLRHTVKKSGYWKALKWVDHMKISQSRIESEEGTHTGNYLFCAKLIVSRHLFLSNS
jgi:hypothetical protein